MLSMLVSRSSSPVLSPGQGNCVVFLGKTLNLRSQCLSPPRCIDGYHAVYCRESTTYEELLQKAKLPTCTLYSLQPSTTGSQKPLKSLKVS